LSLAKASRCVKSGEAKMEVQGAYFRGCYVALIGIVRAAIHLTDAPSASTCFTKAGNYLQIFIHIFFLGGGYLFSAGRDLSDGFDWEHWRNSSLFHCALFRINSMQSWERKICCRL